MDAIRHGNRWRTFLAGLVAVLAIAVASACTEPRQPGPSAAPGVSTGPAAPSPSASYDYGY